MTTQHDITYEDDNTSKDGNLWTRKPVCSCGWSGFPVAAYNDDQYTVIRDQVDYHFRAVRSADAAVS